MKACRGLICSAAVLAVAGIAFAAPQKGKKVPVDYVPGQQENGSSAGWPVCEGTGFEAVEAICQWEAGFGMCGSTFICRDTSNPGAGCTGPGVPYACCSGVGTGTCGAPYPGCSAAAPNPDNCCVLKPHPINSWFMSGSAQHCQKPSIETAHPASGLQHLRWEKSTLGGNPAGCTSPNLNDQALAANLNCRQSAFTTEALPPGQNFNPGITTTSFDISRDVASSLPAAAMRFSQQGPVVGGAIVAMSYLGYVYSYDFELADYVFMGGFDVPGQYYNYRHVYDVCGNRVQWFWDDVLIHTAEWDGRANSLEQHVIVHDNVSPGVYDWDNFVVDRVLIPGPPGTTCPSFCGDGAITGAEECEPGVDDTCCPGQCIPDGTPDVAGECTCPDPTNTLFTCQPRELVNGVNGPFYTDGGFYSYTADAPFTSVDTCASDFDSQIFWGLTPDCAQFLDFNDDCYDDDYGGGQTPGDPNASCYGGPDFVQTSCVCEPTPPGTYTFLVAEWQAAAPGSTYIPPRCSNTTVNIVKKTSCDLGGPIPGGACCNQLTGTCTDGQEAAACPGPFMVYSDNKNCSLVECDALMGACCNTAPGAGGACVETTQADCPTSQYQSWTVNADCDDVTCDEVTGSCCNTLSGTCSITTQGQCGTGADFVWTEGGACPGTCVARTGACCVEPSNTEATCTDGQTSAQCAAAGGVWSDSQPCSAVECTPDFTPIPTVSEWGLAVLALMLLIGGKIYFSRREAAMA